MVRVIVVRRRGAAAHIVLMWHVGDVYLRASAGDMMSGVSRDSCPQDV